MLTEIKVTEKFKSVTPFTWQNVPKLVAITGVNGVGKSQLLEAIYNAIGAKSDSDTNRKQSYGKPVVEFVTDDGTPLLYQKTFYMRPGWQPGNFNSVPRSNVDNYITNFVNWTKGSHRPNPTPQSYIQLIAAIETKTGKKREKLTEKEISDLVPYDFIENEEQAKVNAHLSELFIGYLEKKKQLVNQYHNQHGEITKKHTQEIDSLLGQAPWNEINKALAENNFGYRVTYPEDSVLPFQCKFIHSKDDIKIDFSQLSSGEKMIVSLILWSYNEQLRSLNNLFLMDEPDAHLHPSMSQLFIKILTETLVGEYGIQVILATHNPSTVALLPENSIYVMNRNQPDRVCARAIWFNDLLTCVWYHTIIRKQEDRVSIWVM